MKANLNGGLAVERTIEVVIEPEGKRSDPQTIELTYETSGFPAAFAELMASMLPPGDEVSAIDRSQAFAAALRAVLVSWSAEGEVYEADQIDHLPIFWIFWMLWGIRDDVFERGIEDAETR
jgi:hypothetical protein